MIGLPKPTKKVKKKRKKLQPLPKLLKKVQVVFNKWIRERDMQDGCISCNGEVQNAGHYWLQGSYSNLRFHEDNVHGQCIRCNKWSHGNLAEYETRLRQKIGNKRFKWLEDNRRTEKKWKRSELEELLTFYKG